MRRLSKSHGMGGSKAKAARGRIVLQFIAAIAIIIAADGCRLFRMAGTAPERIPLTVRNNGFFDVDVFSLQSGGGTGSRLGTVTGNSTSQLLLRTSDLQSGGVLMLRLHAIGSNQAWTTPAVTVGRDIQVRLDIFADAAGNLSRSILYTAVIPDTAS